MFGYVLPHKAELKVCEWQTYRAVYCGLCKELKRQYGFAARMLLSYDFVLLALFADALFESDPEFNAERCIANPVQKRAVCSGTKGITLAAHALVLTAYYKAIDNINDDKALKKIPSLLIYPFLSSFRKKAAKHYSEMDKILSEQTIRQGELEKQNTTSPDEIADPTAQMTAALFASAATEKERNAAYRFGYFLGKIIYYLDGAEDYESDKKSGSFNMFVLDGMSKEEAEQEAKRLCKLNAGEMSLCYNLLSLKQYKSILDNIIYMGIPICISKAGQKRTKSKNTKDI